MLIRKKRPMSKELKPSRTWKRSVIGHHSSANTSTIFAPSADTSDALRPLLACKTLCLIIQQLCTESCTLAGFTPAEKPAGMLPLLPLSSIPSFLFCSAALFSSHLLKDKSSLLVCDPLGLALFSAPVFPYILLLHPSSAAPWIILPHPPSSYFSIFLPPPIYFHLFHFAPQFVTSVAPFSTLTTLCPNPHLSQCLPPELPPSIRPFLYWFTAGQKWPGRACRGWCHLRAAWHWGITGVCAKIKPGHTHTHGRLD